MGKYAEMQRQWELMQNSQPEVDVENSVDFRLIKNQISKSAFKSNEVQVLGDQGYLLHQLRRTSNVWVNMQSGVAELNRKHGYSCVTEALRQMLDRARESGIIPSSPYGYLDWLCCRISHPSAQ